MQAVSRSRCHLLHRQLSERARQRLQSVQHDLLGRCSSARRCQPRCQTRFLAPLHRSRSVEAPTAVPVLQALLRRLPSKHLLQYPAHSQRCQQRDPKRAVRGHLHCLVRLWRAHQLFLDHHLHHLQHLRHQFRKSHHCANSGQHVQTRTQYDRQASDRLHPKSSTRCPQTPLSAPQWLNSEWQ